MHKLNIIFNININTYSYGKNVAFMSKGIMIAITKIQQLNTKYPNIHLKPKVILPEYRAYKYVDSKRVTTTNYEILVEYKDLITYTPTNQYDDPFILNIAMEINGLILSNDRFEDKNFTLDAKLYNYYSKK